VPTATPSYYPCLRRPPRGWRRLAFECGAIFSVLLYTGDTSGRRCVTALQSYIVQLKSAYTSSFRQLKSAIRRSCNVRRPCTVAHGLQSVRKEKGKNSLNALYGTHVHVRGRKRKEKKRKEKTRSKENKEAQTRNSARIELGDKIQLS